MTDRRGKLDRKREEVVDADLYEELLNRYERALVFAGQLKEKLESQKLLAAKNEDLQEEVERLNKRTALDEAYIKLLEKSLGSLGVLDEGD